MPSSTDQDDCGFGSGNLAGVGVRLLSDAALAPICNARMWFASSGITPPRLPTFSICVALGTRRRRGGVDANNRILVHQGAGSGSARQVSSWHSRPVRWVAKRELTQLTASDLGFFLGPRLNAGGRLEDMSLGVASSCNDLTLARHIATRWMA
jgi:single-stranded-DNA-specific exonuclease